MAQLVERGIWIPEVTDSSSVVLTVWGKRRRKFRKGFPALRDFQVHAIITRSVENKNFSLIPTGAKLWVVFSSRRANIFILFRCPEELKNTNYWLFETLGAMQTLLY